MADSSQQKASHGDVDHGLGDVEALFVVAHQASPSGKPAEGAFDDPASRQHLEPRLGIDPPHDFDDEVEEGGLVNELRPVRRRRRRTDA